MVTTFPEYEHWNWAGVSKAHQKKTFIAKLSDPPRSDVKHLVFVAAGQQNSLGDDETASGLTGQLDGYKNSFGRKDGYKWVNTNRALPHELVSSMAWPFNETFAASAFDARFNFEFSKNEKGDIVNAFFGWLNSKFEPTNIKSIYLAGHSRGGCLVARLGELFTYYYPNIPVIVHSFDGVCTPAGFPALSQEFGVSPTIVPNPLVPFTGMAGSYFGYKVSLASRYPLRANLAFFNQISGEEVINTLHVHAFSDALANTEHYSTPGTRPWLMQRWWTYGHMSMDDWDVRAGAVQHARGQCGLSWTSAEFGFQSANSVYLGSANGIQPGCR